MKATIKDVAKLAGVSFKTVSRVVNHESVVGEALQKKVWAAIKQLNYHPNLSARELRGGVSSLGFIYDNSNSHYLMALQNGILSTCLGEGFELVIRPCDASAQALPERILEMIERSRVGGVLLTPPISENPAVVAKLLQCNVAVAWIVSGAEVPQQVRGLPCVYVNDRRAAFDITQHLIGLGHRDVAFFAGDPEHQSTAERYQGFVDAMGQHGLPVQQRLVLPGVFTFDSGAERAESLFASDTPVSAVFACNDEIAAGVVFAARKQHIQVPQELSVAGFEDSPFSRQTWPKITTAAQPSETIAQYATRLLIKKIRIKSGEPEPGSEGFVPRLVVRESTAKFAGQ